MADAVTTNVLHDGTADNYIVQLTSESDGTGESAVVKIDLDDLLTSKGFKPTELVILRCVYQISGFNYVVLAWDRQPSDQTAIVLFGQGEFDYRPYGGLHDPKHDQDGTGDLVLTTDDASDGDSYTILLQCRVK